VEVYSWEIPYKWRFIAGKSIINGGFIAGKIIEPNCGFSIATFDYRRLHFWFIFVHSLSPEFGYIVAFTAYFGCRQNIG
jgi:hypothetical protein